MMFLSVIFRWLCLVGSGLRVRLFLGLILLVFGLLFWMRWIIRCLVCVVL